MSEPIPPLGPDVGPPAVGPPAVGPPPAGQSAVGPGSAWDRPGAGRSAAVSLAVVAGSALLGVAAGLIWAAVAPRAALVMVSPGAADLVHAETRAFISADAWFCGIVVVGGIVSGAAGYLLAVRRHGPLAMVAVLAGAVAAAFLTLWVGEQPGRATFHHLLATLPAGAHLSDALSLGAAGALAFWPLAAGLVAGVLELALSRRPQRAPAGAGRPPAGAGTA